MYNTLLWFGVSHRLGSISASTGSDTFPCSLGGGLHVYLQSSEILLMSDLRGLSRYQQDGQRRMRPKKTLIGGCWREDKLGPTVDGFKPPCEQRSTMPKSP